MQGLGCTNADLGALLSCYAVAAVVCYLPSGILADKIRMRTLSWVGFGGTAVLTFVYALLPSLGLLYVLFVGFGITSILIWWGTRFKIVRLCCAEDEYASKIGTSYSIYGAAGLVIGLINAAIVSAIPVPSEGIQVLLVFLGVLIAILAVLSFIFIPNFKGEIDPSAKLFSLGEVVQAIKHPGVIWACLAYFCVYTVYQGVTYTTPFMTTCFAAPVFIVSVVGLIRTYGIGLIAGPVAGLFADKLLKSPSKSILLFFAAAAVVLACFLVLPRDAGMVVAVAALIVVLGFVTYGGVLHRLVAPHRGQGAHGHLRHGLRHPVGHRLHARRVRAHLVRRHDRRPGRRRLQLHLHHPHRVRRRGLLLPGHDAPRHEEERGARGRQGRRRPGRGRRRRLAGPNRPAPIRPTLERTPP